MSLYSARRSVSLDKTRGWYLGDIWITRQTALLNFARSGRHTGQCKSTGGCYNELVVAYFSTGGGVKWRKR